MGYDHILPIYPQVFVHNRQTMLLKKIISGGQTGADQAGLRTAKRLGIETGGWMPQGWRT
jgi:Circularly permutated YpsA SLOG family